MIRPDKKLLRIGTIVLVAAIVLLGTGIALYFADTSSALNFTATPGIPYMVAHKNVSSGTELEYSVTLEGNANISVYLLSPDGLRMGTETMNTSSTLSETVVSNTSGNWSLVILNHGDKNALLSATFSDLNFEMIFLIVFGIVLIPSGLILIYIYFYSRKMERRRERFRNLN